MRRWKLIEPSFIYGVVQNLDSFEKIGLNVYVSLCLFAINRKWAF